MEIKFNNLSCEIGHISDLNITFADNKITSLIGPAGCGKSTILKLINGMQKISDGYITYDEVLINNKTKKRDIKNINKDIETLFQSSWDQVYNLTVLKELKFSLKKLKLSKEEETRRIDEVLDLLEIDSNLLNCNPFEIGQCNLRKVALASILIKMPKILLLDEPTAGLDFKARKNLVKVLKKLKREYKMTIIISSNDVDFLNKVTDNVIVIKQGQIILSGEKLQVFKQEEFLMKNGIKTPKIVSFENLVYNDKKIKIGYRDDVNDLLKDIFRYAK